MDQRHTRSRFVLHIDKMRPMETQIDKKDW